MERVPGLVRRGGLCAFRFFRFCVPFLKRNIYSGWEDYSAPLHQSPAINVRLVSNPRPLEPDTSEATDEVILSLPSGYRWAAIGYGKFYNSFYKYTTAANCKIWRVSPHLLQCKLSHGIPQYQMKLHTLSSVRILTFQFYSIPKYYPGHEEI